MRPIALMILGWPLAEIAGFAVVGGRIGAFNTVMLVVASAVLGVFIIRRRGLAALVAASRDLRGRPPDLAGMLDGFAVGFAGLLLIVPGFLSDAVGLLLLVPGVRQTIGAWFAQNMVTGARVNVGGGAAADGSGGWPGGGPGPGSGVGPGPGDGKIIDVTFTEVGDGVGDGAEGRPGGGDRRPG